MLPGLKKRVGSELVCVILFLDGLHQHFASEFYWGKQSCRDCTAADQIVQASCSNSQAKGMFILFIVIHIVLLVTVIFSFLSFSIILVITFDFNFRSAFVNQDTVESEKGPSSERSLRSRAILARQPNGIVPEQVGLTSFLH